MQKIVSGLFLFFMIWAMPARAQQFYSASEYGVCLGASQYFGDLNDNYGFKFVRPAVGGFVRLHMNPYIALRGSLVYTFVGYDDKFSSDPYNKLRNLNFRSNIFEANVQAEFNFFRFATGEDDSRFTPYLTGGIGVFYYNPYTYYDGTKYYLRKEGTEGQMAGFSGRKYGHFSPCFPVGAGVKFWAKPGLNVGFEISDRLTTTDYLDDVSSTYVGADKFANPDPAHPSPAYILQDRSIEINPDGPLGRAGKQRGNTSTKDQYLMFVINVSIQLKVYRCPGYLKRGFMQY